MRPAALEAYAEWHAWQDIYDRLARIEDRLTPAERREKADAGRKADAAYRRYARLRGAR